MNRMTLVSNFEADMQVAISLLKLSKSVSDISETRKANGVFMCDIMSKKTKKEVSAILASRFGRAVQAK
jgi:hypothetical protein